jgi:prepilin-type N-terminal cleavage/methylation domain-containing protein
MAEDRGIYPVGKSKAFTLIELLLVISIISVLMGMLMPALQRVRKQAKEAMCRSHLREWGLVWAMYVDENEGEFPNFQGFDWTERVKEYYADVDDMLFCRTTKGRLEDGASATFAVTSNKDGEPGAATH